MENNEFKSKDVYFKALKRNKAEEDNLSAHFKEKFLIFCMDTVNRNPNADLESLYDASEIVFRTMYHNPDCDIPVVTIE